MPAIRAINRSTDLDDFAATAPADGQVLGWVASTSKWTAAALSGTGLVDVSDYGAVGDGLTDDTAAINAALATLKHVRLKPGTTYLTWGGHYLSTGQILYGQGATLKQANQVAQPCSGTVNSGSQTLSVTSATGLKAGQWITVSNALPSGATGGVNYDQSCRLITSVVGTTVTTSTTWNVTVAGGTVYTTGAVLKMGSLSRVYDLNIDGNRTNQTFYRWEVTQAIAPVGDRIVVERCRCFNLAGEGIYMSGNYNLVKDCWVESLNGNGVHFSGNLHPAVQNTRVLSSNLDVNTGHAMGAIGWSNVITDATVIGCYINGCLNGFASLDSTDNSDVTISGNVIRGYSNCGVYSSSGTSGSSPGRFVITGNRFYGGAAAPYGIYIFQTYYNSSVLPNRMIVSNNYIEGNTSFGMDITNARNLMVSHNIVDCLGCGASAEGIYVVGTQVAEVIGNIVIGGNTGIDLYSPSIADDTIAVIGNTLAQQVAIGINCGNGGITNTQISNNTITNDATANASYDAIRVSSTMTASGNTINLVKGSAGIRCRNDTGGTGAYVLDNTIRGTMTYAIYSYASNSGGVIAGNVVTQTISNNGTYTLGTNYTVS